MTLDEDIARFMPAEHPDRAAIRRNPYPFQDRLRAAAPVSARGCDPASPW